MLCSPVRFVSPRPDITHKGITRPCQVWEINASTRSKHLCFRVSVTRLLILEVKFADKDVHWIPKSAVDLPVSFATLRHHRSDSASKLVSAMASPLRPARFRVSFRESDRHYSVTSHSTLLIFWNPKEKRPLILTNSLAFRSESIYRNYQLGHFKNIVALQPRHSDSN